MAQGLTTASRGSLDGTLIAAHASRHRLVNLSRLRRQLEEWDRVVAADETRQDPGPIPGWIGAIPRPDSGNATASVRPSGSC